MILFATLALAAGEAEFAAANTALSAGDLPGAEKGYRDALAAGAVDADLYYDLGNVLFREHQRALAILAWRRALVLAPRDPDAEANLDFARRDVVDDVKAPDPAPAWAPWQAELTSDEGQWIGGLLAGAGLLAVALRRRWPNLPLTGVGLVTAGMGVAVGLGGLAESTMPPAAVVLAESVTARSDLGGGLDLFTLHAGAEVQVLEGSAGQLLVSLEDGRKGWIPEADAGRVDPWAPMPGVAVVAPEVRGRPGQK